MDVWIWVVLALVAAVLIAGVWWMRRARRVYVIGHVRVEMHPACVVEDRVIERTWRGAVSMTNMSRRPRMLPALGERATVRSGHRRYLATVYLDATVDELNPADVALAWVEFSLPRGSEGQEIGLTSSQGMDRRWKALRFSARRAYRSGGPKLSEGALLAADGQP